MEIKEFSVEGLFYLYNHRVKLNSKENTSNASDNSKKASVTMIFGDNGIGKTTILSMINGMMELDFNVFRNVEFVKAKLLFSNDASLTVTKSTKEVEYSTSKIRYLKVKYGDNEAELYIDKRDHDHFDNDHSEFSRVYRSDLGKFNFNFIDTSRILNQYYSSRKENESSDLDEDLSTNIANKMLFSTRRKVVRDLRQDISSRISSFIKNSQINSSNYFDTAEPDSFTQLLNNLDKVPNVNKDSLIKAIEDLVSLENEYKLDKFGLRRYVWNPQQLKEIIEKIGLEDKKVKLTIISSYLDLLKTNINPLISLSDRLMKYERIINSFFKYKSISISSDGLLINSLQSNIHEDRLSTGEYHLLYLTSLALCTTVSGTVIAIDEPEMSMHISWQRKLVQALVDLASNASPQMIFATHSPEIAINYDNSLTTDLYLRSKDDE